MLVEMLICSQILAHVLQHDCSVVTAVDLSTLDQLATACPVYRMYFMCLHK